MSEVRTQKIRTSLAQQMTQPGGRTLADVERRANERLGRHKAEVMAEIEAAVAGLEGLCAARSEASAAEVYRLASRILDLAGFFDTGPLFEPATVWPTCRIAWRRPASGTGRRFRCTFRLCG